MKRSVFWSLAAIDDFDSVIAYIAERNPAAAEKVSLSLRKAGNDLGDHAVGRPGRISGIYEKSVKNLPYIIAYAIDPLLEGDERIVILRLIHTARNWPRDRWPK